MASICKNMRHSLQIVVPSKRATHAVWEQLGQKLEQLQPGILQNVNGL